MTSSRKLTPEGPTKPETQGDPSTEGQRKQGRPSHYQQKVLPELVSPDPNVVTEEACLRSADGWYQAILDVRRAAEAGDFPPPLAAMGAIRAIMDGLVFSNKTLSGPLLLPLPEGARLVEHAAPPQVDDPLPDPMTGRDPDGLVPVPLWVLAWLATVHHQAIIALRADTDGKREKSRSIDLNVLIGRRKSGQGNRDFLKLSVTKIFARKMATAVGALLRQPNPPSLERALTVVAQAVARDPSVVRRYWTEHKSWVERNHRTAKEGGQPEE